MEKRTVRGDERSLLWLNRWRACRSYYGQRNKRMAREYDYACKLKHFRTDADEDDNPAQVVFKGRELFSKLRRIIADVMSSLLVSIVARPVDAQDDRYTADAAKWALERDILSPRKGFEIYLERAVLSAAASREGWLAVDWEPNIGHYGEVMFRNPGRGRVMLCPPYQDVWDERLPWLVEEKRASVAWVRATFGWQVQPDDLAGEDGPGSADIASDGTVTWNRAGGELSGGDDGSVTLVYCWTQRDESKVSVRVRRPLPEDSHHALCPSCRGQAPPEMAGSPCPFCALEQAAEHPMALITEEEMTEERLAYARGKRLDIFCPQLMVMRSEPWPVPEAGFPFCKLVRYEDASEPSGISETRLDAPLQTISNQLMQKAWEQTFMAPNVLALSGWPKAANGDEFQFTNDPWQVMVFDDPVAQANLRHFHADPVSGGLASLWQLVQGAFRTDLGVAELGRAAQDPKGVTATTVERVIESGSVPTDAWIKRIRYVLSPFFEVVSAYQRRFWTQERWVRMQGPDGKLAFDRLMGADIPGADFELSGDKTRPMLDEREAQMTIQWSGIANPVLRRALAPRFGIDSALVDELERAEQEQAAQMQQAAMMNGLPGQAPGVSAGARGMGRPAMRPNGMPGVTR